VHEPIEVLLADPYPVMRASLIAALELEPGIRVARQTGEMPTVLAPDGDSRVGVVLADERLADLGSSAAVEGLSALARRVPVVVMGMGDARLYAARYRGAGASGYWAKYDDVSALVSSLREAVHRRPLRPVD
jgi:DNA-binding NarL/FixJ family response regulator